MVSHECNLNSWETEAEVSWELKATLGYRVHSNQLGLQSKTLSQTTAKPLWILQKNACLSVTCYRRPLVRSFRGLLSIMNIYIFDVYFIAKWEVHLSFITVFCRAWIIVLHSHPYYRWCQLYTVLLGVLRIPFPCSPLNRCSKWNLKYIPFFLSLDYIKISIFHGFLIK